MNILKAYRLWLRAYGSKNKVGKPFIMWIGRRAAPPAREKGAPALTMAQAEESARRLT